MAVGLAFRALTLLIVLIILKSLQVHLVGKLDINVSSHQLCHLYLGKCISGYQISSFEKFNPKTNRTYNNNNNRAYLKGEAACFLACMKLALMAELNLYCSLVEISSNPGPSTPTLNALKLPNKRSPLWPLER